jgi:hypothetical protein
LTGYTLCAETNQRFVGVPILGCQPEPRYSAGSTAIRNFGAGMLSTELKKPLKRGARTIPRALLACVDKVIE